MAKAKHKTLFKNSTDEQTYFLPTQSMWPWKCHDPRLSNTLVDLGRHHSLGFHKSKNKTQEKSNM